MFQTLVFILTDGGCSRQTALDEANASQAFNTAVYTA